MLCICVTKFHELVPVVENKDPHQLHACLEQTPNESHLQNSTRHNITLGPNRFLFNDDFGRLTGTEALFQGVRVTLIDPFSSQVTVLLINLWFMEVPINWRQISTLRLACWGVNSWGTDLQLLYDFPSVLIWRCKVYFDAQSSSDSLRLLFCVFSSKILRILSISHNFDLPERGKSLV